MPSWVAVPIDSGAVDTVGPKELAKASEMKETLISKRGIGDIAANGCNIENYGEKDICRLHRVGRGSEHVGSIRGREEDAGVLAR